MLTLVLSIFTIVAADASQPAAAADFTAAVEAYRAAIVAGDRPAVERRTTMTWIKEGATWSLVAQHVSRLK